MFINTLKNPSNLVDIKRKFEGTKWAIKVLVIYPHERHLLWNY